MYKLYVEPDDEITTVIERLKNAPDDVVALIAPKGAALLQSIVNLKLARRASQDAGKTLVLVSTDKIGRNLAVQLGMPVASKESDVAGVLAEGSSLSEDDQQNVIDGVRIHRYYEDDVAGEDTAASSAKQEPIIIPKKITQAKEDAPARPVVEKIGTATTIDKNKVAEKPADEALSSFEDALPGAAHAAAGASEETPPITRSEMKPDPLKTPPSDTSIARSSMNPHAAATNPPKKGRPILPLVIYCTLLILVVAIAGSFFFLPITNAVIAVPSTAWTKTFTFTANTSLTAISSDRTELPATVITANSTDSITFNATGTKDVGNAATGNLTLYNNDSTNPQSVAAGTTVTAGGESFTTNVAISVPGFSQPDPKTRIPGQATVAITAAAPGTASNLSNASIDDLQLSNGVNLSGTVTTSGGTSQTLPIITQADIDNAKTALTAKLTTDTQQKMQDILKSENVHFDSTTDKFTQDTPSVNVNADDQTASGQVQGTAHLARLIVRDTDIDSAVSDRVTAAEPANVQEQVGQTTVTQFTVGSDVKSISLTTSTNGKESKQLSLDTIRAGLRGKTLASGQSYVNSIIPGTTITTTEKPSWWPLKRYPYVSRWLTLSIEYE